MSRRAYLELEDGRRFEGMSFGYQNSNAGEVVFNTAMTGYPESLTDPSYKGQILVATYPIIGNYGVPQKGEEDDMLKNYESDTIQISGFVISYYSDEYSHWNAEKSLDEWMKEHKVSGISGIDTRALTKHLREKGAMLGKIIVDDHDIEFIDPNIRNLVADESMTQKRVYGNGKYRILLLDCA